MNVKVKSNLCDYFFLLHYIGYGYQRYPDSGQGQYNNRQPGEVLR